MKKNNNKGFMLLETLVVSTFILGTLIFLYIQFSAVKRSYDTSFKYNSIPGVYKARVFATYMSEDGYENLTEIEQFKTNGFLNISSCIELSTFCNKLKEAEKIKNILFTESNITKLQNYLKTTDYDKNLFSEEFKLFILQQSTTVLNQKYRVMIEFEDESFASVTIGNEEETESNGKKKGNAVLSTDSVSVRKDSIEKVTITDQTGTIGTPVSSDTNVATVSLDGNMVEIKGVNAGNAIITVPIEESETHNATTKEIEIINTCSYEAGHVWNFDYTGSEQTFTVPCDGTYQLETWGAQGGNSSDSYIGGYGGYSFGNISLNLNENLYINVGGQGKQASQLNCLTGGGYNGGGNACSVQLSTYVAGGGGATHIAKKSGILSTMSNKIDDILIVSAGGGGASYFYSAGSAGGYIGNNGSTTNGGKGGTQTSGGLGASSTSGTPYNSLPGSFGQGGQSGYEGYGHSGGGGAGFYGGGGGARGNQNDGSGAGGSSYIANTSLIDKAMYCYNCQESSEVSTKTISTTNVSETPTSKYAKKGNGYARITIE